MVMTFDPSTGRKTKPSASPKSQPAMPRSLSARWTHEEEMALLEKQAAIIHSSPESALAFLKRADLVMRTGRWRRLVHD